MHTTPIYSLIHWIKPEHSHSNLHIPEWVVYSLPYGFWAFAYALLITAIWSESISRLKYFWMSSIPLLVYGYEILQYFGVITGTFCLLDLFLGTAGLLAGILIGLTIKLDNHEKVSE